MQVNGPSSREGILAALNLQRPFLLHLAPCSCELITHVPAHREMKVMDKVLRCTSVWDSKGQKPRCPKRRCRGLNPDPRAG